MELTLMSVMMFFVGAIVIVAIALKVQTTLQKIQKTLANISWSSSACADKLNFVEQRMERWLQSGDESARHSCQVVMEYNAELQSSP